MADSRTARIRRITDLLSAPAGRYLVGDIHSSLLLGLPIIAWEPARSLKLQEQPLAP